MRIANRRIPLVVMGLAVVWVVAVAFAVTLGVRSVVADPSGPVPNPGHAWTSIQGHFDDATTTWVSTESNQAFEVRVNDSRALRLEPNWSPNVIGGHVDNAATDGAGGVAIGGGGEPGLANRVTDWYGAVSGGINNRAGDDDGDSGTAEYATVGGGAGNAASGGSSTVGGGVSNTASGSTATVGGGESNTASGLSAAIGGGYSNEAKGMVSTVCGGAANLATDDYGTIGGGGGNQAGDNLLTTSDAPYNTVGGGESNVASASYFDDPNWYGHATVGGGQSNTASASWSTVGGGGGNTAGAQYATIAGGGGSFPLGNIVYDNWGTIGGGSENLAGLNDFEPTHSPYNTVGGGEGNQASAGYDADPGPAEDWVGHATVGGGSANLASRTYATVGGGGGNTAGATYATVSGGNGSYTVGDYSTIGGGYNHFVTADYTTVGGGDGGAIYDNYGTIGGGGGNIAGDPLTTGGNEEQYATVGGGNSNKASALDSTVGGGYGNTADGDRSTVGGGYNNRAGNNTATVPGGASNNATGAYSFAAGAQAQATDQGSFVWSSAESTSSWGNNTFTARTHGGARFYTASGTGTGVKLDAGGTGWASISDRNQKENFTPVDGQAVLASLAEIPVTTWNLKSQDESIRHMGPVAQDFSAAFGLGEDELYINTVDADGVALAAIQGLYEIVLEQDARIQELEALVAAPEGDGAVSNGGSAGPLSSVMPAGWFLLAGLVLGGLVVVQRRRSGGRS